MKTARIAIITDIHHGKDHQTKKGTAALGLIDKFLAFVAAEKPDLAIDLGDRISDVNPETDLALERDVVAALRPITTPLFHVCGNHDREDLSVAENEAVLSQSLAHETIDAGAWRVVLWRADSRIRRPGGFAFSEDDLTWLAGVVRAADRPLAIMSHVPISGHSQIGNYYFQRNPGASTYPRADRVRAVLREATVPVVWIAGHVHWNTLTFVDGIPHLTLQSLTETFTSYPEPAAGWALLELGDTIVWKVFGLDPLELQLPAAPAARRWVPPMPPVEPPTVPTT
jgi:Icc protein